MRAYLRAIVSSSYWRYCFSWLRTGNALLAAFGVLWLTVEITTFFSPTTADKVRGQWILFLVAAIVWAIWQNRPKHSFSCRLNNRDVVIEIAVGNLFRRDGALIIGTNTSFDTELSPQLISDRSVQGQFTKAYYGDVRYLDQDLNEQLQTSTYAEASTTKLGKHRLYGVGTVVRLTPKGRNAYLVAIARINEHGVAGSTFEDLRNSLGRLWEFVAERGSMEPLVTPVLGSGFGRLREPRAEIIREIIKSFAAACASRQFCSRLTIVVPPKDFYDYEMDLAELAGFLRHVAQYTEYRKITDTGTGTGLRLRDDSQA